MGYHVNLLCLMTAYIPQGRVLRPLRRAEVTAHIRDLEALAKDGDALSASQSILLRKLKVERVCFAPAGYIFYISHIDIPPATERCRSRSSPCRCDLQICDALTSCTC